VIGSCPKAHPRTATSEKSSPMILGPRTGREQRLCFRHLGSLLDDHRRTGPSGGRSASELARDCAASLVSVAAGITQKRRLDGRAGVQSERSTRGVVAPCTSAPYFFLGAPAAALALAFLLRTGFFLVALGAG